MKNYVLESEKEFERLERQSQNKAYDYKTELSNFSPRETGTILDAGCGSGVVTRYLAKKFNRAHVVGCDASNQRIGQAINHLNLSADLKTENISFQTQDLSKLSFSPSSFDGVVCRYVLEHMSNENALRALQNFYRCMRPSGKLCIIDIDGLIYNLFPQTEFLENSFSKIKQLKDIDLNIGRKLPHLIREAGFNNVKWEIETLQFGLYP